MSALDPGDLRGDLETIVPHAGVRLDTMVDLLPTLLVRFDGEARLVARARPERGDDATNPVAEAGALLAAAMTHRRVRRASLLVPVRALAPDGGEATQALALTSMAREEEDGAPWRMGATVTPWHPAEEAVLLAPDSLAVMIDASPVASMLFETTRTAARIDLRSAIAVLVRWGFEIEVASDVVPEIPCVDGRSVARVRRLATELQRRHAPCAPHAIGASVRSSVPVDLPSGFVPACPL